MAAAEAMLDEVHEDLTYQDQSDSNSYKLGTIEGHNVVIATLPAGKAGTESAASVAKDMLRTFKSIRFGLMVGIGGGVPSNENDIRLGDVVVSQPTGTTGGLIQYDRGKTIAGGEFERTGSLNAPPNVVLTALSHVRARDERFGSSIPMYLTNMANKYPKMRETYKYQGASNDRLYEADYHHNSEGTSNTCDRCDPNREIRREPREDTEPMIHYGIIGSGNQVIKDGVTREKMRREYKVLCLEMEAAGLMAEFRCLVIRGICDYCDTHKNKMWQRYAAAAAAAFAKSLLSVMMPESVTKSRLIVSDPVLQALVFGMSTVIAEQSKIQDIRYEKERATKCHRVFKTSRYERHKNMNPDPAPDTCGWALEDDQYIRWRDNQHDDLFWISAHPGCGKSVLSKYLVDNRLFEKHSSAHSLCYFFFKDNIEQDNIAQCLCAILHQLFGYQPHLLTHAIEVFEKTGKKLQTDVDQLWKIFKNAVTDERAQRVTCILDALDECREDDCRLIIQFLSDFYNRPSSPNSKSCVKFLITSRPYYNIKLSFGNHPPNRLRGEEKTKEVSEEIDIVVKANICTLARRVGLHKKERDRLLEKLLTMSNRTYLWWHLVFEKLQQADKRTWKAFDELIEDIPETLDQAYEKLLTTANSRIRGKTETLLRIVVGARRHLTLAEMDIAFQLGKESSHAQKFEDLDLDGDKLAERIQELCGFCVCIEDSRVHLIHQTVKEFLVPDQTTAAKDGWKHSLDKHTTEVLLTKICVQYLSFEHFGDPNIGWIHPEGTEQFEGGRYAFLNYSSNSWYEHFSNLDAASQESMKDAVLRLYRECAGFPRFHLWTNAHNYLSTFDVLGDAEGLRHIHTATRLGQRVVVKWLVDEQGVNVNLKDEDGNTPVRYSVWGGHHSVMDFLLERGAKIDLRDTLNMACEGGHRVTVEKLLNKGADVNDDALRSAAGNKKGDEKIVQMLLNKGADPIRSSCLEEAAYKGKGRIVQLLLDIGVPLNADILWKACQSGNQNVLNLLIERGGHAHIPDVFVTADNYPHICHEAVQLLIDTVNLRPEWATLKGHIRHKPSLIDL
ncbi:hypothetical protein AJ79_02272 [Helicocarpus griseus UAMH5409]|uniref:NACHT domain-containing protein n=1 Tax=Helicocarpus griseus UAMH5409 TaxID=1447875 RepID=A0A2B7Y4B4_9EURO|nr:hypothetical protein AJ79_02272 [Helicocarpus griseus UAMH5409]